MNEVKTAPIAKINTPMKSMNCEKIAPKPKVNNSALEFIPDVPNRSPKNRRNKVDATLNARIVIVRLVCNFLLSKSFIAKSVLNIYSPIFRLQGKKLDLPTLLFECRELKQ